MKNTISFESKYGWITADEAHGSIISIKFGKRKNVNITKLLLKSKKKIIEYLNGKNIKWDLPIKLNGSPIQEKIWKELKKIPYGKTKSYGEIANKINTSPRYIGNVCGKNRHLLAIPCHRVIRSDGSLGGFSGKGGVKLKDKLLRMEKNV